VDLHIVGEVTVAVATWNPRAMAMAWSSHSDRLGSGVMHMYAHSEYPVWGRRGLPAVVPAGSHHQVQWQCLTRLHPTGSCLFVIHSSDYCFIRGHPIP
jgi:hypothetical protein